MSFPVAFATIDERMNIRKLTHWEMERVPNFLFRFMSFGMRVYDFFFPVSVRVEKLGIREGMTVVDYGCGPRMYVKPVSKRVGAQGRLYALDVHELAITAVKIKIREHRLTNAEALQVLDYRCRLPDAIEDLVYSVDVIHMVPQPDRYFKEMRRLTKPDGVLIMDRGHLPAAEARSRILRSGFWMIENEEDNLFRCKPLLDS